MEPSSITLLDIRIQKWIARQGWNSLREIQENSIPPILRKNCDVIISASTAGGKTEAVFLPVISQILKSKRNNGYQVLYISPLRALINNQYERLKKMVHGLNIPITFWHSDVPNNIKVKSLKNSDGILIITPESLESFLINRKDEAHNLFKAIQYVIIDELHTFIGNERGIQLQSLLSRIEHCQQRVIPRIAMSATFSDYNLVKKFLRNDSIIPCEIPSKGDDSHQMMIIIKEYTTKDHISYIKNITQDIFKRLRGSNNLIFTNSRYDSEKYASLLSNMCKKLFIPDAFRVHHGSLSKNIREKTEKDLQNGLYPISVFCSSTLELGIDIGKIESIAQIESINSVSSLMQRLGRSGRAGYSSKLRIYSIDRGNNIMYYLRSNLVQNIAAVELTKEKHFESPDISGYHFSTLIQQIVAIIGQFGSFLPKNGWKLLCQEGAFCNISAKLFLEIIKSLAKNDIISQMRNGQIIIGSKGESILNKKNFYSAFNSDKGYIVINKNNTVPIGYIKEDPQVGNSIILAGISWTIEYINYRNNKVYVTQNGLGNTTHYSGSPVPKDNIIIQKMRDIYLSDEIYPYLDKNTNTPKHLLRARSFLKKVGLDKSSIIQYRTKTYIFTWAGDKINKTIYLMAKYYLDKRISYNHLYITDLKINDIESIIRFGKVDAIELANLVNRGAKEKQKYDYLLSDELLNIEYANTYLDIDHAWEVLIGLNSYKI